MGISFGVPGLRVRVSQRGVRTSVGPRVARLHFGAGGPGVSTGFGPVGAYVSIPSGRSGPQHRSRPGRTNGPAVTLDAALRGFDQARAAAQLAAASRVNLSADAAKFHREANKAAFAAGQLARAAGLSESDGATMSRAFDVDYATASLRALHQTVWATPRKPPPSITRARWRAAMKGDPQATFDHLDAVLRRPTVDFDSVSIGALGLREAYLFVPIPEGIVPDSEVLDIERGIEIVPIRQATRVRLHNEVTYGLLLRAARRALACNPNLQAVICVGLRSPQHGKGSFIGTDVALALGFERTDLERVFPESWTAEEVALAAQDDMRRKVGADGSLLTINPVDAPDFFDVLRDILPDS